MNRVIVRFGALVVFAGGLAGAARAEDPAPPTSAIDEATRKRLDQKTAGIVEWVKPADALKAAKVKTIVFDWLAGVFDSRWLGLPADAQRLALDRLHSLGVEGGATYDGLIALTAAASDATLVTLDRRALATYGLVGVDVDFVG